MPRGRNRESTSDSSGPGEDSDDGSGGGDTDNGSVVAKQYRDSSGDSDVEDNEGVGAELAMYYGKLDRVDDKEVTLKLNKETLSLFFSKILGKGELDREGRELLRDKYFMAPDQYKKLAPPDLLNTKLHLVKSLDFSGLSGMLAGLHTKTRDVSKVLLYMFENLVGLSKEFESFVGTDIINDNGEVAEEFSVNDISHYGVTESTVDEHEKQAPTFSKENFEALLKETKALRSRHEDFYSMYKKVLTLLVKADGVARLAKESHIKTKEWSWDLLQLIGQADVFLTKTRETKYEDFLQPGFRAEMKNRSRDADKRREKFSNNKLFSKDLDREVLEHSKDNRKVRLGEKHMNIFIGFYYFRWLRSLS